ncbi:dipeptide ABC transporter ATP-binding protein [Mediterraneibacter agrestimuris]|uniref:dipeptide ABC transporter ATP-binding protein n=1 Tax=Mediterraneibacter agrestimuris TaxID=2941333 RepID=UPI002041FFF9|nr:ABC transporter ATP-binding protein [Mediterraneibacter agrestimuris]
MSLLEVNRLCIWYEEEQKNQVVCDLSFWIEKGEMVGLSGASGSGKSSVIRSILGLLPQNAGYSCEKLFFDGEDYTPPQKSPAEEQYVWHMYEKKLGELRGKKIAMVFQDPSAYLNPLVKIGNQLTETILCHQKCSKKEAKERAEELLSMVGIESPALRMNQYPFEFSGGMRQRVVIAIALACEPDLVIADEPTTALDVTVQRQILDLLKIISQRTKTAILLVSHDLGVIASACSRVLVMQEGTIVEEGDVHKIFYQPEHPYTRRLVEKAREVMSVAEKKQETDLLLQVENVECMFWERASWKQAVQREVLKQITFSVHQGETFGLVGESGCGKTTLAKLLTGMLSPSAGKIWHEGKIQMVFQDSYASFDPRYTVEKILMEPFYGEKRTQETKGEGQVEEMLQLVGLEAKDKWKYPQEFSGGQRQRIAIARALAARPEMLILDEPASALDIFAQAQILELLADIQRKTGVSYLFISHDLNVVKHISQKIAVMYLGNFMELGDTASVYKDPWHPYTKQLLSAVLLPDPKRMRRKKRFLLKGDAGISQDKIKGCPYVGQCGYAMMRCRKEMPKLYQFGNRQVRCFLYSEEHTGRRRSKAVMTSQI